MFDYLSGFHLWIVTIKENKMEGSFCHYPAVCSAELAVLYRE